MTVSRGRRRPIAGLSTTLLALAIAGAGLLRLLAARGDLWLDEIRSLLLLDDAQRVLDLFTRIHHDNNHILSSLCLWLLRPFDSDFIYRMPAVLASTAAAAVAAWLLARREDGTRDPGSALIGALLFGGSYLFVQYGSEARGYALAQLFCLVALAAAVGGELAPRARACWLYGAATVLALLSHASSLHFLTGSLAWSSLRWLRQRLPPQALLEALLRWHALPLAAFALQYLGFLRHMTIGGGNIEPAWPVVGRAVAYATGLPLELGAQALAWIGVVLALVGASALARARDDSWVFYAVAALLSPLALHTLAPSELQFERYYLVNASALMLLLAHGLARLARRGREAQVLAALMLAAFLAGNAPRIARLLELQRGQPRAALRYMIAHTAHRPVIVSSDHDFRNGRPLQYFIARSPDPAKISYRSRDDLGGAQPDWYIVHRSEGQPGPPPTRRVAGAGYALVEIFPSAPLSGLVWYLFRRTDPS